MRSDHKFKKIIVISILLLLLCDVSLLFAQQSNNSNLSDAQRKRIQELQGIVKNQIKQSASQQDQQQSTGPVSRTATNPTTGAAPNNDLATIRAAANKQGEVYTQQLRSGRIPGSGQIPGSQGGQNSVGRAGSFSSAALASRVGSSGAKQVLTQTAQAVDDAAVMQEVAFQSLLQEIMPLTPEQIQRLRQQFNIQKKASVAEAGTPPRPVASSKMVSLAPGATPPVIRLAQGFVTSLVFVDSTGAPWPIKAYDLGNPAAFNIQWDQKSNTLMLQSMELYTYGNLAVQLMGLTTPVMITLVPGQKAIDYRVDMRIQGVGPEASRIPTERGLPSTANPRLLSILDGVPPPGATMLNVTGGQAQAWTVNGKLYLRTRLTLLSPGWIAKMSSADGMNAYSLPSASMLLVSDHGKVMQVKLEGSSPNG